MKRKIQLLVMVLIVVSMTGCTKLLKGADNKPVKNVETGQTLTQNILCRPETDEILNIYDNYNDEVKEEKRINFENLKDCNNLKITDKYEGFWTSVFVRPLAIFIIKLGDLVKSYGLAIILATLIIRGIVWPLTKKSALQSENMKKAKPDLDKLERKYKNKQDKDSMMQKSQEMMIIYKKYDINPMAGCLFSFIQIPLFFAFYEAISRIPVIFEETFIGFQLGTSPLTAVLQGHYSYLIFIVLIGAATYYSFKLNSGAAMSSEQEAQMKKMSLFMVVFMTIASFSISTGIAIYWVTSNVFTVVQNLLVKRGKKNDSKH